MEAFAAIFKEFYTGLLLRDVAGKIVPGTLLLAAFLSLFIPLSQVVKVMTGRISIPFLGFIAGLAWTLVLGLQRAAEYVGLWSYYPTEDKGGNVIQEMIAQGVVAKFQQIACLSELRQYERFVVIKEATGNLLMCLLLAAPFLLLSAFIFVDEARLRAELVGVPAKILRCLSVVAFYILACLSLHAMNEQHVEKQYYFAKQTIDHQKDRTCPVDERKIEPTKN